MSDFKFSNNTEFKLMGDLAVGYTVIPNNVMNDIKNIGSDAFTVWAKIVQYANSPTHTVSIRGLEAQLPLSKTRVSNAINHLMSLGYIKRTPKMNGNLVNGYTYEIFATPIEISRCPDTLDTEIKDTDTRDDNKENSNKENSNKKNIEVEEEASNKIINFYYNDYQLSKKKMPHIKKLITDNADKFDLDLWNEIFISASSDNIENKYKYVRAILEDLDSKGIYTLIAYNEKKADQKKSANNPNTSILQKGKKDTSKNIPVVKTRFHNINQTFNKYAPDELEGILQESQKDKFKDNIEPVKELPIDINENQNESIWGVIK